MTTIYRNRLHDEGDHAGKVERYELSPHPESGLFELGDPKVGKEAHHKKNAIFTATEAKQRSISSDVTAFQFVCVAILQSSEI